MRIGVDAIRWVLVVVNFLGVGLLGYTGYSFFFPKERHRTLKPEDPAAYRIERRAGPAPRAIGAYDPIIPIVDSLRPKPPAEAKKEEVAEVAAKEEEAQEGGPLDERWELQMTMPHPSDPSVRVAYLQQRTTPRFQAGRPGTFPAGRPPTPTPRPATPSAPRPGAPGGADLFVIPGKEYQIEEGGKTFEVVRVEKFKLVYRSDGKLYQLTIEKREDPWDLRPEEEDVGIKEVPAAKTQEPPPYDRGKIVRPDGKVIGEEAPKAAPAAAATASPGSAPASRPPIFSAPSSPPASSGSSAVKKPSAEELKEFEKEIEKFRSNMPPEQRKKLDEAMKKGFERAR